MLLQGHPGPIVSAHWLNEHANDTDIFIVDATVHLPDTGRDAKAEYLNEHIPNAIFFDLSDIADPNNPLPRKAPTKALFFEKVGALGINNHTHIVAYDTPGLYSSARVWWLFKLFGYDNVSILNGGLRHWKQCGYSVTERIVLREPCHFESLDKRDLLALQSEVLHVSRSGGEILDARTPGRFSGTEKDRYPGTRSGHIPGSHNLYWGNLLNHETREFLPKKLIEKQFRASGVDVTKPTILSCGSGLTACILALALDQLGHTGWKVYDGSWDEWGRDHTLPIETHS
ncbi:sulfurtransferase [Burkholderiales bacterium]|nr:sulfurtransferase [Burkholderiales bacterium]